MIYLFYFIILFVLLSLYFQLATRFIILDKPCERSSHNSKVIRGGGIIFPIGITFWFIWSGFQYPWFFAGLILISFISLLDDLSNVSIRIRFAIHLAAIFLLFIQIGSTLLPWWVWIIAFFTATSIINAFNFMDGINGLTSSYSLSVLIGLWIVNNYQESFIGNDLLFATGLPVIIFSIYNFRTHARCFAGDVGSVSISFIIIFLLGKLILATNNPFYLMFLCVYGVDTFLTICYRLMRNENIFKAHRKHLYQILANELSTLHLIISSGYAIVQLIIIFVIIVFIKHLTYFYLILFSSGIIIVLSVFYIVIKSRNHKQKEI